MNAISVQTILRNVGLVAFYCLTFWRLSKRFPGDRFIQCSSATVVVLVIVFALARNPQVPAWILEAFEVLLYLLTLLSIFFLLQQGYRALTHRKSH